MLRTRDATRGVARSPLTSLAGCAGTQLSGARAPLIKLELATIDNSGRPDRFASCLNVVRRVCGCLTNADLAWTYSDELSRGLWSTPGCPTSPLSRCG